MEATLKELRTVFDYEPGDLRPMDRDETEALVMLTFAQHKRPPRAARGDQLAQTMAEHFGKPFGELPDLLRVMVKRVEVFAPTTQFDCDMMAWACFLTDRVGVAVLWAYSLAKQTLKHNGVAISVEVWCRRYGDGVPTKEFYDTLWQAQKGQEKDDPDNWIDQASVWPREDHPQETL